VSLHPNPLVPAGANATINRLLARMRDDTCVIERPTSGVDAGGAPISGYTAIAKIACKVAAPGQMPVETISGGRVVSLVDYFISLPPTTDVREDDRIVVNGRTLSVVADPDAASHGYELKVSVKASES
jgi:head-tail adaptor